MCSHDLLRRPAVSLSMALGLALNAISLPAVAAGDSKPTAESELRVQRAEIQQLRRRVAELESQCANNAQPPPAGGVPGGTLKYLLKARWDRLKTGMEKGEVRTLLGWPSTMTRSAAGKVEIWGYGDPQTNRYGVGTIYFDDDEEVTTWMSPTFKTD